MRHGAAGVSNRSSRTKRFNSRRTRSRMIARKSRAIHLVRRKPALRPTRKSATRLLALGRLAAKRLATNRLFRESLFTWKSKSHKIGAGGVPLAMYYRTTIAIAALVFLCANAPDQTRARGALPIISDLGPPPALPPSEPATEIYMSVAQRPGQSADLRPQ